MNAVEIEEAVSELASQPFDAEEFPFAYGMKTNAASAFVTTNSLCQGQQVPILWPAILGTGHEIVFAHTSFKWANLASNNAGVIVIIVGISHILQKRKRLYSVDADNSTREKICSNINAYLVDGPNVVVESKREPPKNCAPMLFGNMPRDGGNLLVSYDEKAGGAEDLVFMRYLRPFVGSEDLIQGKIGYCLWDRPQSMRGRLTIPTNRPAPRSGEANAACEQGRIDARLCESVISIRSDTGRAAAVRPDRARHSSERRTHLPVGLPDATTIIGDSAFVVYDAPLWHFALIASHLHLVWIASVCGKLKTDYRYSNTLGWNTFPVPPLRARPAG